MIVSDSFPEFFSSDTLLNEIVENGNHVIAICPEGTGDSICEWKKSFNNVSAVEYADTESGVISALNSAVSNSLNWRNQDVLIINAAECSINLSIIESIRSNMYGFDRRALGSPRMNIQGWHYLEDGQAQIAHDHLPLITRTPFPTSTCAYIKGAQIELFGPLDESFKTIDGALADFALRINAYGYDSVMLNHVFVEANRGSLAPLTTGCSDWRILKRRYSFLEDTIDRFRIVGNDPVNLLLEVTQNPNGRKPRILLDYSSMQPFHCGTSEYQLGVLKCLNEHYSDKFDVHVFANGSAAGAAFHNLDRYCKSIIYREEDLEVYDLGFYASQPTQIEQQLILYRHCARVVYTMLDAILLRCNYMDPLNIINPIDAVRFGLENCDGIIAISDYSKKDTLDFYQDDPLILSKPIRRIYVASNFGDDYLDENDGTLAEELPFDNYILIAGNSFAHKALTEATNAIKDCDQNVIVVGSKTNGFMQNNVYGCKNGQIDDETLVGLYRKSAAVIFPSVYEGFGLPIVNALKCGRPVIAKNNDLNVELKEHLGQFADNVTLFDTFDELPAIIASLPPDARNEEAYPDSWERFTADLCQFFDELLERSLDLDELRARQYRYTAMHHQIIKQAKLADLQSRAMSAGLFFKRKVYDSQLAGHPRRIAAWHAIKDMLPVLTDNDDLPLC